MFDISVLKEMKLSELQDIAKAAKTIKFNGVKKEVLIAQILENQATASQENTAKQPEAAAEERPKRNQNAFFSGSFRTGSDRFRRNTRRD